jgi:2-C-methyl-D-erythritol 4-phosphate cytidylyltransferase
MKIPDTGVILAAAGEGRRLGHALPKALVPLARKPLFLHSLETFAALPFIKEVVLVVPAEWVDPIRTRYARTLGRLKVKALVPGGARRQDSVRLGLAAGRAPVVLVHDAARPLVSPEEIRALARAAARRGAAVLASPAVDTIKIADARGRVVSTPDRSRVWHAQTPQGFRRRVLEAAYRKHDDADATDDVQLVERAGGTVWIVPSSPRNFKVTGPDDLMRAERLLTVRRPNGPL